MRRLSGCGKLVVGVFLLLIQLVYFSHSHKSAESKACILFEHAVKTRSSLGSRSQCLDPQDASQVLDIGKLRKWVGHALLLPRMLEMHDVSLRMAPPPFVYLRELQHLELYNVNMTRVTDNSFLGLSNLHTLEILDSPMSSMPARLLSPLRQLQHLTLRRSGGLHLPAGFFSNSPALQTLYMSPYIGAALVLPRSAILLIDSEQSGKRTINCSCLLVPFLAMASERGVQSRQHGSEVNLSRFTCQTPARLHGRSLASLSKQDVCRHFDSAGFRMVAKSGPAKSRSVRSNGEEGVAAGLPSGRRSHVHRTKSALLTVAAALVGAVVLCVAAVAFLCCKSEEREKLPSTSHHRVIAKAMSRTLSRICSPNTLNQEITGMLDEPELTPEELEEQRLVEEENARVAEEERLRQEEEERKRQEEEERWRKIKEQREEEARKEIEQQELSNGLRRALTMRRTVVGHVAQQRRRNKSSSSSSDSWSSSSDSSDDKSGADDGAGSSKEGDGKQEVKTKKRNKKKAKKAKRKTGDAGDSDAEVVVAARNNALGDELAKPDTIPLGIVERMARSLSRQDPSSDEEGGEAAAVQASGDGTPMDASPMDATEQTELISPTDSAAEVVVDNLGPARSETAVDLVKDEVMRMLMSLMGGKGVYGEGNMAASGNDDSDDGDFGSDEFDSFDDDDDDDEEEEEEAVGDDGSRLLVVGVNHACVEALSEGSSKSRRDSHGSADSGAFAEIGPGEPTASKSSIIDFASRVATKPSVGMSESDACAAAAAAAFVTISPSDIMAWKQMTDVEKQDFLSSTVTGLGKPGKKKKKGKNNKGDGGKGGGKAGATLKKFSRAVSVRRNKVTPRKLSVPLEEEITAQDLKDWESSASDSEFAPPTKKLSCTSTLPMCAEVDVEAVSRNTSRNSVALSHSHLMVAVEDGEQLAATAADSSKDFLDKLDEDKENAAVEQAPGDGGKLGAKIGAGNVVRRLSMRIRSGSVSSPKQPRGEKKAEAEPRERHSSELREVRDDWDEAKIGRNW